MFNSLLKKRVAGLLVGALCSALFPWSSQAQSVIDGLKQESSQAKVSTSLLPPNKALLPMQGNGDLVKKTSLWTKNNLIAINAVANNSDGVALLNQLQALGLQHGKAYGRRVFGFIPGDKIGELKNVSTLQFASEARKPLHRTGSVTSQGDKAMRADIARQTLGLTGQGSKIGVISDSYDALEGAAGGVASGDLPAGVHVLDDYLFPDGTDEGRAMAEIVHDVAPGANIAFNTAYFGQEGFAEGIINLAKAGCNIIVDDIIYFDEPMFQDGIIAQAVNKVTKDYNVAYFSAAGNNARNSYEAAFKNSGKLISDPFYGGLGIAHDFGGGVTTQKITIPAFGVFQANIQWSDSFYDLNGNTAKTDLDVLVFYKGVLRPDLSSLNGNTYAGPTENIAIGNATASPLEVEIVIVRYSGPSPARIKWVNFGDNVTVAFDTKSSTSYGHANAQHAIAVGAARYTRTPAFNPALAAPVIETFSSAGGTPILFDVNDNAISAVVRNKPEIVAPDGGNTTFFYPGVDLEGDEVPNFFGTSAAAPHAAAVAALMQEKAKGTLAPAKILEHLQQSAIDMDDSSTPGFDVGFDFLTGYGLIQADKAISLIQPLALVQPIFNCQTGSLTFQTINGDGSPIQFMAIGVTGWTTNPVQVVEQALLGDPNTSVLNLMARQNGQIVSYLFNFRNYCQGSGANQPPVLVNPISNKVAQQGAAFSFQVPVNTFADPNSDALTYSIIGLPEGLTFNSTTRTISGTPTVSGNFPVDIVATDPGGLDAQAMFTIVVTPTGSVQPLALIAPLYDCSTGMITFRTSGGDGSPINYIAIGVQRASLSNPTGIVEAGLRADPKPLQIYATQNGVTVSYTFDFAGFCSAARVATTEKGTELQLLVLENPTNKEQVVVEIRGVQGQALRLRMSNSQGEIVSEQAIESAGAVERQSISLKRSAGIYFLQAISGGKYKVVKVLKQ